MEGKWVETEEHFYSKDGAWGAKNSVCGQKPEAKIELKCPACVFVLKEKGVEVPAQILVKEEAKAPADTQCEACICEEKLRTITVEPVVMYAFYELFKDRHVCKTKGEVENGKD